MKRLTVFVGRPEKLSKKISKPGLLIAAFIAGSLGLYALIHSLAATPQPTIYWGAWMDGDVYGGGLGDAPWNQTTWNNFEQHAGKKVSIVHFGQPPPWNQAFAPDPLNDAVARGAIPMMDMGSWPTNSEPTKIIPLTDITNGTYDTSIKAWAQAAKNWAKPFFFRWDWEMNGTWFDWDKYPNTNPADFVAAWKHFHDVVAAQGATNVTWVWCPNIEYTGSKPIDQYYPGDNYVDWTCIDGYNSGTNPAKPDSWKSFSTLFQPTYNKMLQLAPAKPIMVGETASTEMGGSKAAWITDTLSTLPTDFPNIKAFVWFNWNVDDGKGRLDWPIESSTTAQAAFANGIASPAYSSNTFGNLSPLTTVKPLTANSPPPDTTAPSVSLTAPAASATVSGTSTTVSATATDDSGVAGVQFKLDGNNLGSEDTTGTSNSYSTTWNTTTATNGTHTLTAIARDVAGNTKTASSVTVTVSNVTSTAPNFQDGFETGNFDKWHVQALPGRATIFTGGTFEGSKAAHFEVRDGDVEPETGSERAEISGPTFDDGQDMFVRDAIRIPDNITYQGPWQIIQQLHETDWGGSPGVALFLDRTPTFKLEAGDGSPDFWNSSTLQTNRWYDLIYHVKLSKDPGVGFIEVWLDGVPQKLMNGQTRMYGQTIQTDHTYLKAGIYRSAQSTGTSLVDHDNIAVGTSYAGVGGTSPSPAPPPSDTASPTVSFSSPASGATVSGLVTAAAAATDNVGVTKVEISLDGSLKMTDTASPYNYSFDSKTLSNGTHTLSAKAYDAAGNIGTATVTVTVSNPDTTPPNAPANLTANATNATTVNLSWSAATDTGSNPSGVVKYNVLRNGVVIAQPTTTSYSDTGRTSNTSYSYVVQAVDAAGNVSANSNTATASTPGVSNPDLLFSGTKISDYINQSAPGAVTSVPDPAGSTQNVFKMVVKNTDVAPVTPTGDPRAQLLSPSILNNGDDFWWSSKVYLPADFPSSLPTSGWFNLLEGAYGPPFNGSPPWELEVHGDQLSWRRNKTYGFDNPWQMPLVKNQWVSVVVHEKLAASGFIEMWVNGKQATFFPTGGGNYNPNNVSQTQRLTMQTWDSSNNGGANFEVLQSYRQLNLLDSATVYEWPMKIGKTQAAVDDTPDAPVPDTTAPSVPANLTATAVSRRQINLSWDASTDSGGSGLAGYNIYRNGTKINSSLVTTASYGDSTVSSNTTYSYKIEAVDGAGNKSAQTNSVSATTPRNKRGDVTGSAGAPDGTIDLQDVSYVIRNYNTSDPNADISGPDGTPDGKVDLFDLSYIIRNYGQ